MSVVTLMDIASLQALRDRASRVLSWVNETFDTGCAAKQDLTPEDRISANSWYHCVSLFASELVHAGYQDNPEQHRAAIQSMLTFKLEQIAAFERLERKYLEAQERRANAVNTALNLASGGVGDDE